METRDLDKSFLLNEGTEYSSQHGPIRILAEARFWETGRKYLVEFLAGKRKGEHKWMMAHALEARNQSLCDDYTP